MLIAGLQKLTLLDYPGKTACTVFTPGCNFCCPFCHNALLVTHTVNDFVSEEEFFTFLSKRKGVLDGVCITGGEPLLQKDIFEFCKSVKEIGLLIKLDTNGSCPGELKKLLDAELIDYIAMDIKNSPSLYARTCGVPEPPQGITESVEMIMNSGVDYEFRTTIVRELHNKESITELCQWIQGAKKYYLQCFKDSGDLIESGYSAYSEAELEELLAIAKLYIPSAQLRGV
jgi:pyruvate formate lyase activating enzyme